MTTQRIQMRRTKGWRMPPNTVKVDRSTKWGNPFIVGEHGNREECVRMFALLMSGAICLSTGNAEKLNEYYRYVSRNRRHLRGKNLACWCPSDKPCHADILLMVANK